MYKIGADGSLSLEGWFQDCVLPNLEEIQLMLSRPEHYGTSVCVWGDQGMELYSEHRHE